MRVPLDPPVAVSAASRARFCTFCKFSRRLCVRARVGNILTAAARALMPARTQTCVHIWNRLFACIRQEWEMKSGSGRSVKWDRKFASRWWIKFLCSTRGGCAIAKELSTKNKTGPIFANHSGGRESWWIATQLKLSEWELFWPRSRLFYLALSLRPLRLLN